MQPTKRDLVIVCGASFDGSTLSFTWQIGGNPVDLTGYRASMRAALAQSDGLGADIFNWTDQTGRLLLGGPLGTITPQVAASDTLALWPPPKLVTGAIANGVPTFKAGIWVLELTSPSGEVSRLLQGDLLLIQKVQ